MVVRPCPNEGAFGLITIDLAFEVPGEASDREAVGDEAIWSDALINWIDHIRSDQTIHCPQVVRDCAEVSLGLRFTDDISIAELNGVWRQRAESTDVLSFAALEGALEHSDISSVELGDIVISLETARRQALEQGHSLERELHWLVSHGLLHLLGWDHPDQDSLAQMLALQEQLLDIGGNVQTRAVDLMETSSSCDAH